jgi:flagellin-like hook-associated protein FlgL
MRVQQINQDRRDNTNVKKNLQDGRNMMTSAETSATSVVDMLQRMKQLVDLYWQNSADPTAQAVYENEFDALNSSLTTLTDNSYYFDTDLMQAATISSINLDPDDLTNKIDITYDANDIVDATGLDIDLGDEAASDTAVDTQLDRALSYLSKTSTYVKRIETHLDLVSNAQENLDAFESTINGVDDVAEMSNVIDMDIRQQASLSMIAQGNMSRMNVLKLIDF